MTLMGELWLRRKISLFVEKHIEIFRSDGALGLQLALKWLGKKISVLFLQLVFVIAPK